MLVESAGQVLSSRRSICKCTRLNVYVFTRFFFFLLSANSLVVHTVMLNMTSEEQLAEESSPLRRTYGISWWETWCLVESFKFKQYYNLRTSPPPLIKFWLITHALRRTTGSRTVVRIVKILLNTHKSTVPRTDNFE